MSNGTVNGTLANEVQGSLARELDAVPQTVSPNVEWQALLVRRYFIGFNATWLPSFFGETPPAPGVLMWLPPVAWRRHYRKRYSALQVDFSVNRDASHVSPDFFTGFTASYTCVNTMAGSGYTPATDGNMLTWWGSSGTPPPFQYGPVITGPEIYGAHRIHVYTGLDGNFAQWVDFSSQNLSMQGYMSGASYTGAAFSGFPDDYATNYQSLVGEVIGFTLSTEITFTSVLSDVATEIQADTFPTFDAFGFDFRIFNDWMENYDTSSSIVPAHWDGSVILASTGAHGMPLAVIPYFGADTGTSSDYAYLWTGWFYDSSEEESTTTFASNFSVKTNDVYYSAILSQRNRFKTGGAVPYFIAEATVVRLTRFDGAAMGSADIDNVVVKASGTTVAGTVYEIPWPTDAGFDDFIAVGTNQLSMGKIRFAIVGETAAAWTVRTGIPHT